LLDRPGWSRAGLGGDRPLPLICVIGQPEAERFVAALVRRLADAEPRVLFARVELLQRCLRRH